MKKAIVLVQGISSREDYISKSIKDSNFDLSIYDKIVVVRTEEFFEKNTPWYMKPFKIIPVANSWADKLGDVLIFMTQKKGRVGACRKVRMAIQKLQKNDFEVELLTHSLGTIITLVCGPNNLDNKKNYKNPYGN